jgi:hypothetical protein
MCNKQEGKIIFSELIGVIIFIVFKKLIPTMAHLSSEPKFIN